MKELEDKCLKEYQSKLGGKTYTQLESEYNNSVQNVLGKNAPKDTAQHFVENAKTQAAYTEIGVVIATTMLMPYTATARSGMAKTAEFLGEKAATQVFKGTMTLASASMSAGAEVVSAATSSDGLTDERIEIAKEKFTNGLMYGGFGAYVSGPMGEVVTTALGKNPALMTQIVSKTLGAATETTADVLFDRVTTGLDLEESLKQNGVMNFGMAFLGGRMNKVAEGVMSDLSSHNTQIPKGSDTPLKDIKVMQNTDGTIVFKDNTGKELFKAASADEAAGFVIAKGLGGESEVKSNDTNNPFISNQRKEVVNDGTNQPSNMPRQISSEEFAKLKSSDANVKAMPDGTVVKVDEKGSVTEVLGKLYDKAKTKINSVVDKLTPDKYLMESTSNEAYQKILKRIKNDDGTQKFSDSDINMLLLNLNENAGVKAKDLAALMSLEGIDAWTAASILTRTDSPQKLEVLNVLTDKYTVVAPDGHIQYDTNPVKYSDIEFIMDNLKDCQVSDVASFYRELINNKRQYGLQDIDSVSSLLITASFAVKTDVQKEAFMHVLNSTLPYKNEMKISYDCLIDKVVKKVESEEDLNLLKECFEQSTNVEASSDIFEAIKTCQYEDIRELLINVLHEYEVSDTKGLLALIDCLDSSSIDFESGKINSFDTTNSMNDDVTVTHVLKMVKNGVPGKVIRDFIYMPEIPSNHLLYERINNGKCDSYDLMGIAAIRYDNDFEKQALNYILDNNQNERFEAVAMNAIIDKIQDEESLLLLKKLVSDRQLDTHTIIKSLDEGKIIESPLSKTSNTKVDTSSTEAELRDMLGMKKQELSTKEKFYKMLGFGNKNNLAPKVEQGFNRYMNNLVELNNSSPKRFQKMVDSGLFDLIKEGKIDVNILKNLDENTFLSNRTLREIRRIRDNEPYIKNISSQQDFENISKFVENGDVCEFNGKLYVNNDGTPVEINLTKEKFEELFPPLSSVTFEQKGLGDCWLVSTLDNFMDLPKGRVELYKLFKQDGNDVLIQFANGANPIRFENGEVLANGMEQIQGLSNSELPNGIRMIEQAYAVHRYRDYDTMASYTDIKSYAADVNKLMQKLEGGMQYEAVNEIFGETISFDFYGDDLSNRKNMRKYIAHYANDPNTLVFFGTKCTFDGKETVLAEKYDIYDKHAYSIKGYDEKTGMVYITNPWRTSIVTEVPMYELLKYIDDVNFAQFN